MPGDDDDKKDEDKKDDKKDEKDRPMGTGTAMLRAKEIDAGLESQRIDADLKKTTLQAVLSWMSNMCKTVLPWTTKLVGVTGVLLLLLFALYYNREFFISGFGLQASTGGAAAPAETPKEIPAVPEAPK